jgi:hypothetical protein
MPLTAIEQAIIDKAEVSFAIPDPTSGITDPLTYSYSDRAQFGVVPPTTKKYRIPFQFPPKILSDNKGSNWQEQDVANYEPFALYMGGSARTFTIQWSYIITDTEPGSTMGVETGWDVTRIATAVKSVRSYFYQSMMNIGPFGAAMILGIQMYDIIGIPNDTANATTFRADGLDVAHSETLIKQNDDIYPLRTDLSLKCKFWIQIKGQSDERNKLYSSDGSGASKPPVLLAGISDKFPGINWR